MLSLRKLGPALVIAITVQLVAVAFAILVPSLHDLGNLMMRPGALAVIALHMGEFHGDMGPILLGCLVNVIVYSLLFFVLLNARLERHP
ncbi:MAG TPA: hypothetical protein VNR20_07930 [Terriglobales bacterium]|nr:hypothetical protein [Terriglobales bacterium]